MGKATSPARRFPKRRPLVALAALRRLIKDPERTDEVFVVVRNLSGDSLLRAYDRFRTLPGHERLLQRSLLDVLNDRDHLRSLPAGSLGREYLAFVERESLTADGLVAASENSVVIEDEGLRRFAERNRDMHDLWHVLTGYGRDTFGEVCLLAFTYAQMRNTGIGVIAFVGTLKHMRAYGAWRTIRAARQGYRMGRKAAWLPGEDWEALLQEPLDALRERLNLQPPDRYQDVRQLQTAAST